MGWLALAKLAIGGANRIWIKSYAKRAACQVEALREPTRPVILANELKSVAAIFEQGKGHYSA